MANLDRIFYILDFACEAKCHGIAAHCCTTLFLNPLYLGGGENIAQGGDPKYSSENI